jgi:hypothetical protein
MPVFIIILSGFCVETSWQTDITNPICFHFVYVMQIIYKRQIDTCPFHRTNPKTLVGNQSVANIFKLDNRITTPQPSFLLLQTQFNIQFNLFGSNGIYVVNNGTQNLLKYNLYWCNFVCCYGKDFGQNWIKPEQMHHKVLLNKRI